MTQRVIQREPLIFQGEVISLFYFTAMLGAVTYYIFTRDGSWFRPANLGLIAALGFMVFFTNIISVLLKRSLGDWGGVFLFGFLLHYVTMALLYANDYISMRHLSLIYGEVIPGFLLGLLAFGEIHSIRLRALRAMSPRIRGFFAKVPTITSLVVFFIASLSILVIFYLIKRTDIFLIENVFGDEESGYQLFGGYMLLAVGVVMSMGLSWYLPSTATTSSRYVIFVILVSALTTLAATLLSLVGSNKEIIALLMMWALAIIYAKPRHWILRRDRVRISSALLLLFALGLLLGVAGWLFVSGFSLPRLGIFQFGEDASIWKHPSLVSRIEILLGPGMDQLAIAPLLGDLGAEFQYGGEGTYIHSIISVQSHLGFVGTALILGYLGHRLNRLYRSTGNEALKVISPPILFIALIATFFTWIPFWFLMGALFAPRVPRRLAAFDRTGVYSRTPA